jgi:hypothetical protein
MPENLYYANEVFWSSVKAHKRLLICGGITAEVMGMLWKDGFSTSLAHLYDTLSSVSHYKFHMATILCGSIATGIGRVVLHSWSQEIEKVRNTPPNSPTTQRATEEHSKN